MLDLLAEESLGGSLHLAEDHGRDLLGSVRRRVDLNVRLLVLGDDGVRHELLVGLDGLVGELAADEALDVEDGLLGVDGGLVLRGVAHEPLAVREGYVRGGDAVALVVGDYLHAAVLEHADAGVGGAEVDADHGAHLGLVVGIGCGGGVSQGEGGEDCGVCWGL